MLTESSPKKTELRRKKGAGIGLQRRIYSLCDEFGLLRLLGWGGGERVVGEGGGWWLVVGEGRGGGGGWVG